MEYKKVQKGEERERKKVQRKSRWKTEREKLNKRKETGSKVQQMLHKCYIMFLQI